MSIRSFPSHSKDRQAILILDKNTIHEIGNAGEEELSCLHDNDVLVVPYPVSNLAKNRSLVLSNLIDQGLIQPNQMLLLNTDDNQVLEKQSVYLPLDKVILNFLN